MNITVHTKHLHVHMPALPLNELLRGEIARTPQPASPDEPIAIRRWSAGPRHTRIAETGAHIAADDTTTPHVAVIDHATGLMWSVESLGDASDADGDTGLPQADCEKRCAELRLLGYDDWRLPTRAELAALVDDTRHEPAIDSALFPRVKPRWHWTSTAAAWSSASAWGVDFDLGLVDDIRRGDRGFALAVRRAGQ